MKLLEQLRKAKSYLADIETAYEQVKQRREPTPLNVILPVVYKHTLRKNEEKKFVDERAVAFVGQYLSVRYPELTQYFLSNHHKETMKDLKQTLDEFMDECTEEKS